jgi:class 3 adenylate cyclase
MAFFLNRFKVYLYILLSIFSVQTMFAGNEPPTPSTPSSGTSVPALHFSGTRRSSLSSHTPRSSGVTPRNAHLGAKDVERELKRRGSLRPEVATIKNVCVMFCSIRNFTAISKSLTHEQTIALVNDYFDSVHDYVKQLGGTVKKFSRNEALIIFEGVTETDACQQAVQTAKRIISETSQNFPNIISSIGMNYGEVYSGIIGTKNRCEFTTIGNSVNAAKRIEVLCEDASSSLLVSNSVYNRLCDDIKKDFTFSANTQLRGMEQTTDLYKLTTTRCHQDTIRRPQSHVENEGYQPQQMHRSRSAERLCAIQEDEVPRLTPRSFPLDRPVDAATVGLTLRRGSLAPESTGVKNLCIMYCDICKFTTHSETLNPVETIQILNQYFCIIEKCVSKYGGRINTFIGDEALITFDNPISERSCQNALDAAIEIIAETAQLNLKSGIGIHFGEVFCGLIGSRWYKNYTFIGDVVDTAKALQSICKNTDHAIITSDTILENVSAFTKKPTTCGIATFSDLCDYTYWYGYILQPYD